MSFGEQRAHLFDLYDLLGGAAEKAQQGVAEWLTENTQARKNGDTLGKMRIAAPGKCISER